MKRYKGMTKKELIKELEELKKTGALQTTGEMRQVFQDLRAHQAELEKQNRKLAESQSELEESRNRYAEFYDFAPVGYSILDEKGIIHEINLRGAALLGRERLDIIGKPFSSFVVDEDISGFFSFLSQLEDSESSERKRSELRLKTKKELGDELRVELISAKVRAATQQGWWYKTIITDISERKKMEEELRKSEERYRTVADFAYDWEQWVGTDGNFIYISPSCERITGYGPEEFSSDPGLYERIVHPDDLRLMKRDVDNERLEGDARQSEFRIIRKDGDIRWIHHFCQPVKGSKGELLGRRANNVDITERKLVEDELRRINEELAVYAHTVSHDLKGPVSAILLSSSLLQEMLSDLKDDSITEDIREVAATIEESSRKAQVLIKELLVLAEAGQVPAEVEEVDVLKIVEGVLEEESSIIRQKGIEVMKTPELGKVRANATQMYQLFSNLIRNALQNSDTEKPRIEISYHDQDASGAHRYLVKDNGSGVPHDIIDKIFHPFFKGKDEGIGIGLAIVQEVLKVYDGKINVYNDDGACFEFSIKDRAPVVRDDLMERELEHQ